MTLMKPIEPPRRPGCASCGQWSPEVGLALGFCRLGDRRDQHDVEGKLVRSMHTRGDEQFACHEPKKDRWAERIADRAIPLSVAA